jgi:hypothetical protein
MQGTCSFDVNSKWLKNNCKHFKTYAMSDIILKVVLPTIGLIIILFCVGAYFFKYGTNLKDSTQEFKMFGADMKISIITVFVLVGLILIFAGTYFNVINTNSKLAQMLDDEKKKNDTYQGQLREMQGQVNLLKLSQNKTLNYFLDLDGIAELPNTKNLKIYYKLWGDEDRENTLNCSPVTTNEKQRLLITIPDIKPETFITSLVVEDIATKRKWKAISFFPLSPSLKLSPVN